MSFDPRLVHAENFVPHPYDTLGNAFPPGAVPEAAYRRLCEEYSALKGVSVQRITYVSDGLKVTGMMAAPPGAAGPLLIYNRGGNREFGKLTVYNVMRVLAPFAQAGYTVFASNYRGNDGGEGREEFGGSDVGDVLTLLSIARRYPQWDGMNAFMLGHSRGGMMTYRAIAEGAQLQAAVSLAGVADILQSEVERPAMKTNVYDALIGGDHEEEYRRRSALCWPEKLSVPLMLMHGDADERVQVSHSIRLAEKLEEAGMPHTLVIYQGGNHALVRDWADVIRRSQAWFERYRRES